MMTGFMYFLAISLLVFTVGIVAGSLQAEQDRATKILSYWFFATLAGCFVLVIYIIACGGIFL
jgi:hypothetical protein